MQSSFELNQSYPLIGKTKKSKKLETSLRNFDKYTGQELNSCNYVNHKTKRYREKLSVDCNPSPSMIPDLSFSEEKTRPSSHLSLNSSWSSFHNISMCEKSNFELAPANKAVLTIDAETSEILTVSKQACCLFGYTSESLISTNFSQLLKKPPTNSHTKQAFLQSVCARQGNVTVESGKVLEIIGRNKEEIPVALWMKRIQGVKDKVCYIIVLEPVVRIVGKLSFNSEGTILTCNENFAGIHGYPTTDTIVGGNIKDLMPSYRVPKPGTTLNKSLRKQYTTSATADGHKLPLSVYILSQEKEPSNATVKFHASVWLFTNVNGPVTITSSGIVESINSTFSLTLLGYQAHELRNKNIAELIPDLVIENENCNRYMDLLLEEDSLQVSKEHSNETSPSTVSAKKSNTASSDHKPCGIIESDDHCDRVSPHTAPLHSPLVSTASPPPSHNSALDQINSLLLGKCSPASGGVEEKLHISSFLGSDSSNPKCEYVLREVNGSWVEISIKHATPEKNAFSEPDNITKINLLLNGSLDILEDQNTVSQNAKTDVAALPSSQLSEGMSSFSFLNFPDSQSEERSPLSQVLASCNDKADKDVSGHNTPSKTHGVPDVQNSPLLSKLKSDLKGCGLSRFFSSENVTSTPLDQEKTKSRSKLKLNIVEGYHVGQAKHKDGSLIPISFEIRRLESCDLFCIWISLSLDNHKLNSSLGSSETLYSSFNSTLPSLNASAVSGALDFSLGAAIKQAAQTLNASSNSVFLPQEGTNEWYAVRGEFGRKYDIARAVGNGAYGFVRNARKKSNNKKFVVKFIRKEKILEECWVDDYETESLIPLEIALLTKFRHPNIVEVVEFFENERYFAMVMPKHGQNGIDLFEFIDREPRLDELLASFIFRQIVSAIYYLHREGVVHRDIKDENVIIDENFSCKLIDFGSAAFFKREKTFATFCGTVEYCSPEVLLGGRYEGPALEVWALGVTLYTLVYGENPFRDIEETIEATLKPPHYDLSVELLHLIRKMLQPVPEHRCKIAEIAEDVWVNLPIDISEYSWDEVVPPSSSQPFSLPATPDISEKQKSPCDANALFDDASFLSSNENLAAHAQYWREEKKPVIPNDTKDDERRTKNDRDCFPLTKRLENINLNHSI